MLPDRDEVTKPLSTLRVAGPAMLLLAVLSLPCVGLGYFWDDFVFLARVQASPIAAFGTEPGAFYRPIPRALYFWPLAGLGTSGALLAHILNLSLALLCVYLLAALIRDLAGARAGAVAGMAFAALGTLPGLVAWASGSQ